MKKITFRFRLLVIAGVVSTFSAFGGVLAMVDTRPVGVRAHDWAHSNRALPRTWAGLAAYPREYRRAAFGEFTPAEKSSFVREYVDHFRRTERLTREQEVLLDAALRIITPETFSADRIDQARGSMKPICERIETMFDNRQKALLASLGSPNSGEQAWRNWVRGAKQVFAFAQVNAKSKKIDTYEVCQCAVNAACTTCGNCLPGTDCTPTPDGCGCFLLWSCDGFCAF